MNDNNDKRMEAENGPACNNFFNAVISTSQVNQPVLLTWDNEIINPLSEENKRLFPLITNAYQRSGVLNLLFSYESFLTVMTVIFMAEIRCDQTNQTLIFEFSIIISLYREICLMFSQDNEIN